MARLTMQQLVLRNKELEDLLAKSKDSETRAQSNASSFLASRTEVEKELNAMHEVLSAMQNPPPMNPTENSYQKHPITTRFAIWLANNQHKG